MRWNFFILALVGSAQNVVREVVSVSACIVEDKKLILELLGGVVLFIISERRYFNRRSFTFLWVSKCFGWILL